MSTLVRKPNLTAFLPATACTPEMRAVVEQCAQEYNLSMGEVQRLAVEFFLNQHYSLPIGERRQDIEGGDAA